ncbi:MAG TPA: sigma 54-interacting transcriptional regulator [Labilithrix sp.]
MGRTDATLAAARRIEIRGGRLIANDRETSIVIGAEPVLVGRDAGCTLVVPEKHVSAVHAELVATERGVRVRDLGSRNGTWLGDTAIVEAYLTASATLSFGAFDVAFEATEPERVKLPGAERFGALWGTSPAMRQLFAALERVAQTDLTLLVQGETGTGKELVAQAIHAASARKDKPFVVVDCGSIAPSLAESLLFGHERGAFTGAVARRESPFVEAAGGTVFLDELGELPLEVQPKLLRALAERRVQSVGGSGYKPFDARIVAATRRDLLAMVADGSFRSDLYFRVAQLRATLPSLRQRIDDIPGLIREMLAASGCVVPDAILRVRRETMTRLMRHDWPGNVRELRNAVSVALALARPEGDIDVAAYIGPPVTFRPAEPPISVREPQSAETSYHDAKRAVLASFDRAYFARLLAECEGSVVEISRRAGLQRAHVRRHLRENALVPTPRRGRRKA